MSQIISNKLTKNTSTNPKVASSLVHKPFSTGKINIFNPPKNNPNGELMPSKLVLNATLEDSQQVEELIAQPKHKQWIDLLLNPWTIIAIAVLLLANIFSGIFIWRNSLARSSHKALESTKIEVGSYNLATKEFAALNLNTLSTLTNSSGIANEDVLKKDQIEVEIPPALLPLNLDNSLDIDTQYHYILAEYKGDHSLALVKQKVNNISLVNLPQGLFIYLGAFTQKSAASQFVKQLKTAEIDAYIYPFKSNNN